MSDAEITDIQKLCNEIGRIMYEGDQAVQAMGITLDYIAPGAAGMSMRVRDDMTNMLGYGHGGFTFALADSVGGYACNSRNRKAVAQVAQINYLAPTKAGDVLRAVGREAWLGKTYGMYDISVTNQDGVRIAEFRSQCHNLKGRVIESLPSIDQDVGA
jgi:acyl-CoA thioesterase